MTTSNGVPTVVVEKILDTMKEVATSMKNTDSKMDQVEDAFYKNLEKVAEAMTDLGTKLTTPPRHQEIIEKLEVVKTEVEQVQKLQIEKTDLLKSVVRTIKIGAALFSLAVLIGSIFLGVVEITKNKSESFFTKQISEMGKTLDKLEQNFNKHIGESATPPAKK
jgi:hypothetical protein